VLTNDLGQPAPSPATASKCRRALNTGSRKTEKEGAISLGKEGGGPKSYDITETLVLCILYFPYCVDPLERPFYGHLRNVVKVFTGS
jgi:hypothetical protein